MVLLRRSVVSSSTEIWRLTRICEGERALSMTASLSDEAARLTCKYASASLFIFVLRYPKLERTRLANLHVHVHVFPH